MDAMVHREFHQTEFLMKSDKLETVLDSMAVR